MLVGLFTVNDNSGKLVKGVAFKLDSKRFKEVRVRDRGSKSGVVIS